MIILAIETSCDDTAAALLEVEEGKEPSLKVLSNVVSSQIKIHAKYGGVYPSLAKRAHQKNLPVVFKKALGQAKADILAVTSGPGLEPCLWQGINFSKEAAKNLKIPVVPVNHIESHILANFIKDSSKIVFPAIALVVSGGHTQIILMRSIGKYQILGETRDDAAGECFDKTARILGLGYPGGPAISLEAAGYKKSKYNIHLPRPMIFQKNYDFSFSGLKTAVLYDFKSRDKKTRKSKEYIREMAASIQQAVIDVLTRKTLKAAKDFQAKTILLGGGVVANKELRKQFQERIEKEIPQAELHIPAFELSTDNAVMTAITGYYQWRRKKSWKEIKANANLRIGNKL